MRPITSDKSRHFDPRTRRPGSIYTGSASQSTLPPHPWWQLLPRNADFHPTNPPQPRIHPQDDGAGLGNSLVVALYRQNFNDDMSVTAYEAAHEWRDYWRLPPEIRDRLYPDHKEEALIRIRQHLSMTETERYHEAVRGSQAFDTSLPVHLTSPSMSHNALLKDYLAWEQEMDNTHAMDFLASRREARVEARQVQEAFEPSRARPRMR